MFRQALCNNCYKNENSCEDIQVQILGVVAKIQVRSLRTEVRQGSIRLLSLALGELILSLK